MRRLSIYLVQIDHVLESLSTTSRLYLKASILADGWCAGWRAQIFFRARMPPYTHLDIAPQLPLHPVI
jgi:hypothetical protein